MSTIKHSQQIPIYSGKFVVSVATVSTNEQGSVIDVDLNNQSQFFPIYEKSVEIGRLFELDYQQRYHNTTISNEQAIATSIARLLICRDYEHASEDAWMDAAYEDRYCEI